MKREGMTDKEIADDVGCSNSTLYYWKKDNKVAISQLYHKAIPNDFTPDDYLKMKDEGYKDELIAHKLQCSASTLTTWKQRHKLIGKTLNKSPGKIGENYSTEDYLEQKKRNLRDIDIIQELGVSLTTLNVWKRENGLKNVRLPRTAIAQVVIPKDFTVKDYESLKNDGLNDTQIATDRLHVGMTSLYRWKKKHGIADRSYQVRPGKIQNPKYVIDAVNKGVPYKVLAERFGVTENTIYKIVRRYKEATYDNISV